MASKILVVEDEPLLLMLAVGVVEEAGFEAIEARDADEAIRLLEEVKDIRLLWTDIDMPGSMNGLLLAATVRERWPPVEIIVVSGKTMHRRSCLIAACFSVSLTTRDASLRRSKRWRPSR